MPHEYMIDEARLGETGLSYKAMLDYAKNLLPSRTPLEISDFALVEFDEKKSAFSLNSLGQIINVSYPEGRTTFSQSDMIPSVFWNLSILHYLYTADGTPLSKELITFRLLKDGLVRGGGFDRDCSEFIGRVFGDKPLENIKLACQALGAEFIKANSDLCTVFPYLPRYPLTMKIWLADEEMPGSGQILLDSQADHYLSMEDAVIAGNILLEFLQKQYLRMFPL